jgi:hypothetical protein
MKWWKKAAIVTIILIVLIAIGDLYMMQRIKTEASSPAHRDAWETKLGEVSGQMFGFGTVAIWAVAWSRERQKRK